MYMQQRPIHTNKKTHMCVQTKRLIGAYKRRGLYVHRGRSCRYVCIYCSLLPVYIGQAIHTNIPISLSSKAHIVNVSCCTYLGLYCTYLVVSLYVCIYRSLCLYIHLDLFVCMYLQVFLFVCTDRSFCLYVLIGLFV